MGGLFNTVFLLLIGFAAMAQPTPGKEKISIDLPATMRWKSTKVPKDTKAIRGILYTVRGEKNGAPVDSVVITTIDKRYFSLRAEGTPEEKWAYVKSECPTAELTIVDKKIIDAGRTAILYLIKPEDADSGACSSSVLLTYVIEGPTALHTIEVHIPTLLFNSGILEQWRDILLRASIS